MRGREKVIYTEKESAREREGGGEKEMNHSNIKRGKSNRGRKQIFCFVY